MPAQARGNLGRAGNFPDDLADRGDLELSSEFSIQRPDHIVLTTNQPDKLLDFYQKLGFVVRVFGVSRNYVTA
jgi:hypothetical protein